MPRSFPEKPISRRLIEKALDRLEKEGRQSGRSLRQQLHLVIREHWQEQHQKPDETAAHLRSLPLEFFRELVNLGAGQARRTPGQQIARALQPWSPNLRPRQLQNWYGQIYGEFAKEALSTVMREVLLFALRKDEKLMHRIHEAIIHGEVRTLEQIARCVALVHGIRHEGTGQAARVASRNRKLIGFAYLHLFERHDRPPHPAELRVELACDLCLRSKRAKTLKFSEVWYLLRSGSTDDQDRPGPNSRYDVVSSRYIKRVIKSLRWPLGVSPRGHITVKQVKSILRRIGRNFVDDSKTVFDD